MNELPSILRAEVDHTTPIAKRRLINVFSVFFSALVMLVKPAIAVTRQMRDNGLLLEMAGEKEATQIVEIANGFIEFVILITGESIELIPELEPVASGQKPEASGEEIPSNPPILKTGPGLIPPVQESEPAASMDSQIPPAAQESEPLATEAAQPSSGHDSTAGEPLSKRPAQSGRKRGNAH